MKNNLFLVVASRLFVTHLFLVSASFSQTCVPPPSGLISWWPGNGNANDIVGANHGTLQNGATFVTGKVGQAFSFDGVNDFIRIEDNTNLRLGTGEITVVAWIKASPGNTYRAIAAKFGISFPYSGYGLRIADDNKVEFFAVDCATGGCGFSLPGGTGTRQPVRSTSVVADNAFHHVAGVRRSDGTLEIYVDGVAENTRLEPLRNTDSADPFTIGEIDVAGPEQPFNGLIDELGVFNRALSASEIQTIGMCQAGTISGSVHVGPSSLADVTVKLLDSDGNLIPAFPAITTSNSGTFSFTNVPSGLDYQVMIVEPLGYSVDANPKLLTLSAATAIIDFTLTIEVVSNKARDVPYWKHQFDEHRCRRRHCDETEAELNSYIAAIHEHYDPHFNIFQNLTTIEDWDGILTVGGRSTMRDRAKKQLAALLMNLVSLKIGQYTKVTRDNHTAGDVLTYVSGLITDNSPSNDQLARTLAMKVNNREIIAAGVVSTGNILYKSGGSIDWEFSIPKEFTLFQNYPNPFNPSTEIRFSVEKSDRATLNVYDILGQHVASLFDDVAEAGQYYKVRFDASNLASGVYIYRLQSGKKSDLKKLLLLR